METQKQHSIRKYIKDLIKEKKDQSTWHIRICEWKWVNSLSTATHERRYQSMLLGGDVINLQLNTIAENSENPIRKVGENTNENALQTVQTKFARSWYR